MLSISKVDDPVLLDMLESYRAGLSLVSEKEDVSPESLLTNNIPSTSISGGVLSIPAQFTQNPYGIAKHIGAIRITNACVYKPASMMGWHTNANAKGRRLYLTYSYGNSVFRYQQDDRIIDSYDYANAWTSRSFEITDIPFWHCVATNDHRITLGFKL